MLLAYKTIETKSSVIVSIITEFVATKTILKINLSQNGTYKSLKNPFSEN